MGSIIPATDATHGPFRKVADVVDETKPHPTWEAEQLRQVYEVLVCGHRGKTLYSGMGDIASWQQWAIDKAKAKPGRRRCWECRVPVCGQCGGTEQTEDNPIVTHHRVYGWEIHEGCKAAHNAEAAAEEAHWAGVRERNLARRRTAGEDV